MLPVRALALGIIFCLSGSMAACNLHNYASGRILSVWLMCGFSTICEAAQRAAAGSEVNNRKTFVGSEYDIRENHLSIDAGLQCCGGEVFSPEEAAVAWGLSEKVSVACGLKDYNQLNELCCELTVSAKPAPNARCCGKEAFSEDTQLCCGPIHNKTVLQRQSSDHLCCGHNQFNNKTECCCSENVQKVQVELITSRCCQAQSAQSGAIPLTAHKLCGQQAFSEDTQLCCGPIHNKTVLQRQSSDHLCCGHNQFNNKTECCCSENVQVELITSRCCQAQSGVQQQKPSNQHTCVEKILCNPSCCNLRNRGRFRRCTQGRFADVLAACNLHTPVCCDDCVSKPRLTHYHGSHGQHLCGTGVYQPHSEICCDGHRHRKMKNTHCCGTRAYDIKDTRVKCCAGKLHDLTTAHQAQCCGSSLQIPPNVCCSSEDKEKLYPPMAGFGCCGHHYFNTSLWSCCAGKLSKVNQPGLHQSNRIKESRLLSVHNLNEADLCQEMHVGMLESVSLHSVVFTHVLKINGRNGTVTPLPSPHILKIPDYCVSPAVIPGKDYFFDEVNIFTHFNRDLSIGVSSLNLIFSKCYHDVTTTT